MNTDDKDFVKTLMLAIGAPVALIVLTTVAADWRACVNYERVTGKATQYKVMDQCYIEAAPGDWQRWDEYKLRAVTNAHSR